MYTHTWMDKTNGMLTQTHRMEWDRKDEDLEVYFIRFITDVIISDKV